MSLGSRRLHCFGKMPKPAGETPTLPETNAVQMPYKFGVILRNAR